MRRLKQRLTLEVIYLWFWMGNIWLSSVTYYCHTDDFN